MCLGFPGCNMCSWEKTWPAFVEQVGFSGCNCNRLSDDLGDRMSDHTLDRLIYIFFLSHLPKYCILIVAVWEIVLESHTIWIPACSENLMCTVCIERECPYLCPREPYRHWEQISAGSKKRKWCLEDWTFVPVPERLVVCSHVKNLTKYGCPFLTSWRRKYDYRILNNGFRMECRRRYNFLNWSPNWK